MTPPLVVATIDVAGDLPRLVDTYLILRCLEGGEVERIEQLDDGTFELHTAAGRCNVDAVIVPPEQAARYAAIARRDPVRLLVHDGRDPSDRLAAIRPRAATPNIDYE